MGVPGGLSARNRSNRAESPGFAGLSAITGDFAVESRNSDTHPTTARQPRIADRWNSAVLRWRCLASPVRCRCGRVLSGDSARKAQGTASNPPGSRDSEPEPASAALNPPKADRRHHADAPALANRIKTTIEAGHGYRAPDNPISLVILEYDGLDLRPPNTSN